MSNSQEQSLNDDARILPLSESSPHFVHSEKERKAVERLLSAGPEAFYSCIDTEQCSCFLSPEEVDHISSWAQDCYSNRPQVHHGENGLEGHSEVEDPPSTYFPSQTDTPTPKLDLGWPEKRSEQQHVAIRIFTSPPAEGQLSIRGVIRWHLQNARQLIAIVTDSLTDGLITEDLHNAASRGVPVYIILNQRSTQESFTLNRLKHPNIRVRVLGGKTFRSQTGQMVVGEMKEKFLLVDSEAVIVGSYSLTWTDAHLHRQLITVLSGPVVDFFNTEFRVLFANTIPCSDVQRPADTCVEETNQLKAYPELLFEKPLPLGIEIPDPPSPPADAFLDWEAMGVNHISHENPEKVTQQLDLLLDYNTPNTCSLTSNSEQVVDVYRVHEISSSLMNQAPDLSTSAHLLTAPTDPTMSDTERRVNKKLDKAISRRLKEQNKTVDDRTTRLDDRAAEESQDRFGLSAFKRIESYRRESVMQEERDVEEVGSKEDTKSRPIIMRVPEHESFMGHLMRRLRPQPRTGLLRRASKDNVAEMTHSMLDLRTINMEERESRFSWLRPTFVTPASALMQNRNSDKKVVLQRTPKTFLSAERHRGSGILSTNLSQSPTTMEGEQEKEGQG